MLDRSLYEDDSRLEPEHEEHMQIVAMLSERINDRELEEGEADVNELLGELADINEMTERISKLKRSNNAFILEMNGKALLFDYKFNEAIFDLDAPAVKPLRPVDPKPNCNCCQEPIKSAKESKVCTFCTLSYCAKCCKKTRAYPKAENKAAGEIC